MAESLKDVVRVVFLDKEGVLGLEGSRLGGAGVRAVGGMAGFVHQFEGLGAVVFLAAWFGGVIEVVHVLLVELGLLVTLSKQVRQ